MQRLLARLDCDQDGVSLRTGAASWPESMELSTRVCQEIGGERLLVLVLASWLEGLAKTTRRTYAAIITEALRDMRTPTVSDLACLPDQAGLTWQRLLVRRQRLPRTVNAATACLNSLMGHVVRLGLAEAWAPIPAIKITKGRHIDREAVVLSEDQLLRFLESASRRPARQFVALVMASLHGLRASEVAGLTWGSIRHHRRGGQSAPAVIHVVGKGRKHRVVHVHPAVRSWLERERRGRDRCTWILADDQGRPPSPQVVSWWAKDVFRRAGLTGYAHALRATWTTAALENRSNDPLQVQQSGGWREQATMLGHYFKRRNVKPIRLIAAHGRY